MNQCIWEYNKGNYCDCKDYCIAKLLLANVNQNKQGKLEAETSLNKNNRLPQLEAIKTNIIKKI